MGIFVPRCSQNIKKDRQLKDFNFSNIYEEGESPDHQTWNFTVSKMTVSIIL